MRILSIDSSTTSTGWCIYENKPIKYGCICPNKTLEYIDRVIYILKEWRKYCNIKGKKREELKQNAVNYIKNKYKIEVNDDTAESICIAEYGNSIKLE